MIEFETRWRDNWVEIYDWWIVHFFEIIVRTRCGAPLGMPDGFEIYGPDDLLVEFKLKF